MDNPETHGPMTIDQVCEYLQVSRSTVNRWIRDSNLPVHKIDRTLRFYRDELDAWVRKR